MKHNYILPHFIKFFYRASPVAASGHLQYFLSFFFTLSIFLFRSSHRKGSIKKLILNILRKTPPLESLFNPATSLKRDPTQVFSCEYSCSPIAIA